MEFIFEDSLTKLFNNYVKKNANHKLRSNELLNNIYILHSGLNPIEFENSINWNYEHHTGGNTYQLYLHTLNFVNNLVYSYFDSNKEKYILKAKNIIEDWIENNSINMNERKYVWYDHTVSNRLTNILFYQSNVPDTYKINERVFNNTIVKHINFLANDSNYAHNNHGIMMDKSIILSSIFIKDDDVKTRYINVAKRRVENAILRDYSYMSTHLENSPDYHVMVTAWLTTIGEILQKIKNPLNKKYQNKLKNAVQLNGIISNYSNQYPMLGDTGVGRSKVSKSDEDFVDLEAGLAIFNDREKKSTLVFNCGFQNLTHKHQDDLSFVFSINGEEIFIDSGKYNYLTSDPIRQLMVSPKAHTTIYVKDKNYPLISGQEMAIKTFIINDKYKYVAAINYLYESIKLIRHIILIDGDTLIVYDDIYSERPNTYVQNYILNENLECEALKNKTYKINSKKHSYILTEQTNNGITSLYYGKKSEAVISRKFNEITDVYRLEFKKKTKQTNFITTFTPEENLITDLNINNSILSININNEIFKISLFKE